MQIQTYHPSAHTFLMTSATLLFQTAIWYAPNSETSWYGLDVRNLGNGKLELTGTGTDLEEQSWFDVNTKSIIPVNEDWVIQADAFHADYPGTSNETRNTVIGFEAEYQQYDFEFFVGPSSWGYNCLQFLRRSGRYICSSFRRTFGNAKTGELSEGTKRYQQ